VAHVCNPLSIITGSICPHYKICRKACVLGRERSRQFEPIADNFISNGRGRKVLIIGSGPAGLASAWQLKNCGFAVTVAEREPEFGGALRLISDTRLNKTHIDNVIKELKDVGVTLKSNTSIDFNNIEKIKKDFDCIIFATGTWNSRRLDIEGEEFTVNALDYLKISGDAKKTVVIGGGNVAVDCAVEAIRRGGSATICYRKTEQYLKAEPFEIEHAKKIGVQFEFEMVPQKIVCDGVQFGRKFMPCEQVVVAVGQFSDLPKDIKKCINVLVVGDAVIGASSVVQAVLNAKECVRVFQESHANSSNLHAR